MPAATSSTSTRDGFDDKPGRIKIFCDAASAGDISTLEVLIREHPELVNMDLAENDEHRAIHYAVLHRHPSAVKILMEAGSDASKGIYPNRTATTARAIASDRGFDEITDIIAQAEQDRRARSTCPNITVTPQQEVIHASIRTGKVVEAIEALTADPGLIHVCDRDGASPLHIAAEALNASMVNWLLVSGASIRKVDALGRTPLDRAVLAVDRTRKDSRDLFAKIADQLVPRDEPLSVRSAVALGDLQVVRRLHQETSDLFEPGQFNPGLLSIAVRHGKLEMVRLLLDLGFDPNERVRLDNLEGDVYSSGSPLWQAAVGDDFEIATILLNRGADPNAAVYASGTPTAQSFATHNRRMEELMTERGGTISPEFMGLHRQTEQARQLLSGLVTVVVNKDAYSGPTLAEQLLWGAACGGDAEIVRMALDEITWARDDKRWYNMAVQPLRIWNHGPGFWAVGYDRSTYTRCFEMIIKRCDVNALSRQGTTILHRVASDGDTWGHQVMTPEERIAFATLVLDAGARFDPRDELLQSTPLAWAARWGRTELVALLLERGAPRVEPDGEPWTAPLAWAERYGHTEIAAMLK